MFEDAINAIRDRMTKLMIAQKDRGILAARAVDYARREKECRDAIRVLEKEAKNRLEDGKGSF